MRVPWRRVCHAAERALATIHVPRTAVRCARTCVVMGPRRATPGRLALDRGGALNSVMQALRVTHRLHLRVRAIGPAPKGVMFGVTWGPSRKGSPTDPELLGFEPGLLPKL